MLIEHTYRIYHRLQKEKSLDLCEKIIIIRDREADLATNPTAVKVLFIPEQKRELKQKEKASFKKICDSYNLGYYVNDDGELVWYQQRKSNNLGKRKPGRM